MKNILLLMLALSFTAGCGRTKKRDPVQSAAQKVAAQKKAQEEAAAKEAAEADAKKAAGLQAQAEKQKAEAKAKEEADKKLAEEKRLKDEADAKERAAQNSQAIPAPVPSNSNKPSAAETPAPSNLPDLSQVINTPPKSQPTAAAPQAQKQAEQPKPQDLKDLDMAKVAREVETQFNAEAAEAEKTESPFKTEEDRNKWTQVLDYVAENGWVDTAIQGVLVTVQDGLKSEDQTQVRNEITVIGGPDGKGGFAFSRVQIALTNVVETQGGLLEWRGWSMMLSRESHLVRYQLVHATKDKRGVVKDQEAQDVSKADAEKVLSEMRKFWFERLSDTGKKEEDLKRKEAHEKHMEKLEKEEAERKKRAGS